MEIIVTAFYIVACVLLFALAILIHEFGHFIVALKLGLKVEAFSIGFGPAIWKKKFKGVEYRVSWIPLGGYVSIPDVDPEGTRALEGAKEGIRGKSEEVDGAKTRIAPWKEVLVSVAGPLMNIVLAVVIAVALSLVPNAKFGEIPTEIGKVAENGPAAKAGLKAGDKIIAVNGNQVKTWSQLMTEVQIVGDKEGDFDVIRCNDNVCELMTLKIRPEQDKVTEAYYIMAYSSTNNYVGSHFLPARSPVKQLMWDAGAIFRVLGALVTPKDAKATAKALGGPVMIAEGIYKSIRADVWDGLGFLRFLNMNLAVLNLMPIPVLDGGLILFSLIALIFRRRLPDWFVAKVTTLFMYLLIAAMGIIIFRDVRRSYRIHTYNPEAKCEARSNDADTDAVSGTGTNSVEAVK